MYEMVYNKQGRLSKDDRLAYYSYMTVLTYPGVFNLGFCSLFYMTSQSFNIALIIPSDDKVEWPFFWYVVGASVGLIVIIVLSDLLF